MNIIISSSRTERALDPDGQPLRADLLVANQLPVGLTLDDLLEVIDEVIRTEEVIEFPQSLLFKNQLIGDWELIDWQLKVEGRPTPTGRFRLVREV